MKLRASVLACVTAFLPLQNACAAEPGWPQSIAIATASPGGTYDVYGQALADILGKELGIEVTARGHRVRPDDPKYALPLRPSADCGEARRLAAGASRIRTFGPAKMVRRSEATSVGLFWPHLSAKRPTYLVRGIDVSNPSPSSGESASEPALTLTSGG